MKKLGRISASVILIVAAILAMRDNLINHPIDIKMVKTNIPILIVLISAVGLAIMWGHYFYKKARQKRIAKQQYILEELRKAQLAARYSFIYMKHVEAS